MVEAAGIETCAPPMKTQQFQWLGSTADGVRVECSDEGMQRHEGVHPSSRSRRTGSREGSASGTICPTRVVAIYSARGHGRRR